MCFCTSTKTSMLCSMKWVSQVMNSSIQHSYWSTQHELMHEYTFNSRQQTPSAVNSCTWLIVHTIAHACMAHSTLTEASLINLTTIHVHVHVHNIYVHYICTCTCTYVCTCNSCRVQTNYVDMVAMQFCKGLAITTTSQDNAHIMQYVGSCWLLLGNG